MPDADSEERPSEAVDSPFETGVIEAFITKDDGLRPW
jgi:hypothetical protein